MKKTLSTMGIAFIAFLSSMICGSFHTSPTQTSRNPAAVFDTVRKCGCGGTMRWTAKAKKVYKKCTVCNGKGKIRSGNYVTTCSNCKGTGKDYEWKSGYKCNRCNAIALD